MLSPTTMNLCLCGEGKKLNDCFVSQEAARQKQQRDRCRRGVQFPADYGGQCPAVSKLETGRPKPIPRPRPCRQHPPADRHTSRHRPGLRAVAIANKPNPMAVAATTTATAASTRS